MFLSKSFIPLLKNYPSEAKIKSHQLMLRIGIISALVLMLSRPVTRGFIPGWLSTELETRLLIVIDNSSSMNSFIEGKNSFDKATEIAKELLEIYEQNTTVSIAQTCPPKILFSGKTSYENKKMVIDQIKPTLEELPHEKLERYINEFKIEKNISKIIISEKDNTKVFEKMISETDVSPKVIASWLVGDIFAYVKENNFEVLDLLDRTKLIMDLLKLVSEDVISNKAGKEILPKVLSGEGNPNELVKEMGLEQVSNTSELEKIIDEALVGEDENIAKFQGGSDRVLGYFVGKCLKASKGKGNPKLINKILIEKLQK